MYSILKDAHETQLNHDTLFFKIWVHHSGGSCNELPGTCHHHHALILSSVLYIFIIYLQIPELTEEQLAELEEKMTEEHFSFIMDLMDDIRMSASSTVSYPPWSSLWSPSCIPATV